MRLAAASAANGRWAHCVGARTITVHILFGLCEYVGKRASGTLNCSRSQQRVTVRRYLAYGQRDRFDAAGLGQRETVSKMHWKPSTQIRQRKSRLPVAAIGRAYQVEECLVFTYWQQLPFAEHPPSRSEVACEHSDLTDVWLCHLVLLLRSG